MAEAQDVFNNQFLTDVFRRYEKDDSIKIDKFEIDDACESGGNFTCDVSRVTVHGTKKDEEGRVVVYKTSIIAKRVPKKQEHLKLYRSDIALENEVHAYNTIIPALTKYAAGDNLPVAGCVHAGQELVLLQDLQLEDYDTIDKAKGGLDLEQCRAVVQALAKIHAASMVLQEKEPEVMETIRSLVKELMYHGGESELLLSQQKYTQFALNTFKEMESTPENKKAVEILEDLHVNANSITEQRLMHPEEHVRCVINHGDAWIGNIMFNKENDVKLIDLQLMRYSSVAADLCYMFYVNVQPSLLEENLDSLLQQYLEALKQNIREKEVNLDEVLTESWLRSEMAKFAPYGLIRALWVTPMFFYKPEDVDLSNVSLEVLTDTDAMVKKIGPAYRERVKGMVLNYIKKLIPEA